MAMSMPHDFSFECRRKRVDDFTLLESVVLVLQILFNVNV